MVWITIDDEEEDYQILGKCAPALQLESATASTMFDHLCSLSVRSRASVVRLSSIICVMGIACREPETLEKMIELGMNIAILNFGHGSQKYHSEVLENIKIASENYTTKHRLICSVAIAVALKGPVIRVSFPVGGASVEITLYEGDIVEVTGDENYVIKENRSNIIYVNYEDFHNVIKVGDKITIDSKRIVLICVKVEGVAVSCQVLKGGDIRNHRRVHLPGIPVNQPALEEKDKADLRWSIENDVDIILAPYIRSVENVNEIREFLGEEGKHIRIMSQIENYQGLDAIDAIIKASDGIVVARGDLCNEIYDEEVFLAQKSIISKCNTVGKPVICTTQMLESMKKNVIPTRAEASDVANAILDGADCVTLYHETTIGDHPLESLKKMASICKQAEAAVWQKRLVVDLSDKITPPVIAIHAIASAAAEISFQLLASAIIIVSASVKSAQLLTQYRPKCPVLAVTRNRRKARQAHLFRGILPLLYKTQREPNWIDDLNSRIHYGINFGRKHGFIRPGDPVVLMTSSKQGSGFADKMKVLYVTKHISYGTECIC